MGTNVHSHLGLVLGDVGGVGPLQSITPHDWSSQWDDYSMLGVVHWSPTNGRMWVGQSLLKGPSRSWWGFSSHHGILHRVYLTLYLLWPMETSLHLEMVVGWVLVKGWRPPLTSFKQTVPWPSCRLTWKLVWYVWSDVVPHPLPSGTTKPRKLPIADTILVSIRLKHRHAIGPMHMHQCGRHILTNS